MTFVGLGVRLVWKAAECGANSGDVGQRILGSIVVSIPACHAGDRGSIPRRGDAIFISHVRSNYDQRSRE